MKKRKSNQLLSRVFYWSKRTWLCIIIFVSEGITYMGRGRGYTRKVAYGRAKKFGSVISTDPSAQQPTVEAL